MGIVSCITKGNVRCTKCCEVLHIPKNAYQKHIVDKNWIAEGSIMFGKEGAWTPVSYRRAKKINRYLTNKFQGDEENKKWHKVLKRDMQYFTCRYVVKGVGCSIRDTDKHPQTCKIYKGGYDYSYTCNEDINIIARSTD